MGGIDVLQPLLPTQRWLVLLLKLRQALQMELTEGQVMWVLGKTVFTSGALN
jgi:hypothetical protein